jgi:hypothetical protein
VILALSILSLISFTFGLLSSLGSTPGPPPAAGAVAYLVTIATGIGFVVGWRWSWFAGFVLAVAGVVFGVWVVSQIGGTLQTRSGFAVLWVGPPLLLLVCLLLPASLRWVTGTRPAWVSGVSIPPPPEVAARRRSLLLPTVTIVVAIVVVAAWFVFGRGPGSFPDRAAGFALVFSRTVDGGVPFGPPISSRNDLRVVRQRIAAYAADGRTFEVRIIEDRLTSEFPHKVLLRAAGIGIATSTAFPEGRLGEVIATTIEGVRYTCVHTRVAAGCIWTDDELSGWALGDGPKDVARLRALSRAVHDAMT